MKGNVLLTGKTFIFRLVKYKYVKCTNFTVFLSLFFLCHATSTLSAISNFLLISVLCPSCSLLCSPALVPFPSVLFFFPLHWFGAHLLSFPLIFFPVPSFFLHQIFKLFLVCTSLTPMPHYRLMAPTVGFSPPLCVTLAFLTPTSTYITPLFAQFLIVVCLFVSVYLCCSVISCYILLIILSLNCHCAVSSVLSLLFHQVFPLSDCDVLVWCGVSIYKEVIHNGFVEISV